MYALRHKKTGNLMGFYSTPLYGGECADVEFSLTESIDNVWVVQKKEVAEKVANDPGEWYNAWFTSPLNRFVGELEVVEIGVLPW